MTREMQKRIKQTKENAAILVRYANPRSKSKPAFKQVKEILSRHIPYCGGVVPAIVSVEISEFHRNSVIKSAYFIVTVENGKKYKISAYEDLTGRTPEQKEADKNADFPSGLFKIFHDEIKEPKTELEQKEEETEMKEFAMIEKNVREDHEKRTADTAFYIENGYFPTWAEEHRTDLDRGLKANSTETRWKQYQAGTISREKAVGLATKRAQKEIDKNTAAKLAQLDRVANAPDLTFISVSVEWVRSRTWGHNPHVEVRTNTGAYTGTASGYGYDKESAAIADAFNKCDSILKALYQLKENGLRAGKTDESKTASCGRSNGDICGYGAGYGAIPYFEGGVGASCFWSILKNCGFSIHYHYTKHSNFYSIEKEATYHE